MRVLLDEMIGAVVSEQLRRRGHDVVAVQDPDQAHIPGIDDCVLLAHAHDRRRAIVTDNVPDFYRCHERRIEAGLSHRVCCCSPTTRSRVIATPMFVSRVMASLERVLTAHPDDDASGWVRWLTATG